MIRDERTIRKCDPPFRAHIVKPWIVFREVPTGFDVVWVKGIVRIKEGDGISAFCYGEHSANCAWRVAVVPVLCAEGTHACAVNSQAARISVAVSNKVMTAGKRLRHNAFDASSIIWPVQCSKV